MSTSRDIVAASRAVAAGSRSWPRPAAWHPQHCSDSPRSAASCGRHRV